MQIDSETIRLSCEPFRRGPVFKSQPDCLVGNLHSINQRDFLFKLELFFFFQRSPQTNYSSGTALQKRALQLRWQGWSVRRRLSQRRVGGDLVHVNSGGFSCAHRDRLIREPHWVPVGAEHCICYGRRQGQCWSPSRQKGSIPSVVISSAGTISSSVSPANAASLGWKMG